MSTPETRFRTAEMTAVGPVVCLLNQQATEASQDELARLEREIATDNGLIFEIHHQRANPMTEFEYIQNYYNVPAELGRRVIVNGKPGIIAEDRGHYIGVNFDHDKPGVISNCHPTWEVEYLDIGSIRKLTRSQQRLAEDV